MKTVDEIKAEYRSQLLSWSDAALRIHEEAVLELQTTILNWVFTINGGGIAGAITLLVAFPDYKWYKAALICFTLGLASNLVYGVVMLHYLRRNRDMFSGYRKQYVQKEVSEEEFIKNADKVPSFSKSGEFWGTTAGILSFLGLLCFMASCLLDECLVHWLP